MKWYLFFLVLIVVMLALDDKEAPLAANRASEQRELLIELERSQAPQADVLAAQWAKAYPAPDEKALTELRLVVERVKKDPSQAASFTIQGRQKARDELPFEPAFGWSGAVDKPGL